MSAAREDVRLFPGTARVYIASAFYTQDFTSLTQRVMMQAIEPYAELSAGELMLVLHVRGYWAYVLYGSTLGWVWAPHLSNT